ncbi:MAG: serine/threonine protein phosphatase [Roseburia sp.]|nr:serine/threonine protein phosphatase [Roseburia sp.]
MKTGCERRLDKSFKNAPVLPLYPHSRVVLFSDCHRGTGNANDNFMKNQNLYFAALQSYYSRGFTYIELGDGDELWENRSISAIHEIHSDVFCLLSLFDRGNRRYMLYGNHDHAMKNNREIPYHEGMVLKLCGCVAEDKNSCLRHCLELYLTHGHQAELLNSVFWKLSRFLVRYLWKPLEQLGVLDPTSTAKNYVRRNKSEKRLSQWAVKNGCYLVTGHTHRPVLGDETTHYFNTGSCVHPQGITCLEIEDASITLVKWAVEVKRDNSLFVAREVLAGPISLYEL